MLRLHRAALRHHRAMLFPVHDIGFCEPDVCFASGCVVGPGPAYRAGPTREETSSVYDDIMADCAPPALVGIVTL